MRIGIDISQIVYEGTGVGRYVKGLVTALVRADRKNEYILFGSSLRLRHTFRNFYRGLRRISPRVRLVTLPFPPIILEYLWNRWHIVPVEWIIGNVDVFWSSDWTQPPLARAVGVTTIHDLTVLRDPESANATIRSVHTRRLHRSIQECRAFLCDSEATKQDVMELLNIDKRKLYVVYPGLS